MNFSVTKREKAVCYALILLGLVCSVLSYVLDHDTHGQRFWSNFFIDALYFFLVALGSLFFIALSYATETGWSVLTKRVSEAIASFIPYASILLLLCFLASSLHINHLYHWMDPAVTDVSSPLYDKIIADKSSYLNVPFFWIRTLIYMSVFIIFYVFFRRSSIREDMEAGTNIHFKNFKMAAVFLVLFAVFSSTLSWDWIMSIDTHWFSTLFGWYVFSGMWCSAMVTSLLLVVYLKRRGFLQEVNDSHIHDLSKWVFALSFLWSYMWFSQFMLIWYSNIPEEITYYIERFSEYKFLFLFTFIVNFTLPMVFFMSRSAKRSLTRIKFLSVILLLGHWLDVYLMITPGTLHDEYHLGFIEIGMLFGFGGLFCLVVLKSLEKAPLVVKNHPFLEESKHHHF